MNQISHKDRQLLVSILGMLGSSQDGERAAAGRKASELLIKLHLSWDDVIIPTYLNARPNGGNPYGHKITPMHYPNFDIKV